MDNFTYDDDDEEFQKIDYDLNQSLEIILNFQQNQNCIYKAISTVAKFAYNLQIEKNDIFVNDNFTEALINIMKFYGSTPMLKKCLIIISNIWSQFKNITLSNANCNMLNVLIHYCQLINNTEISPYAFFAVANFCGISKETRDLLINMNIFSSLLTYMRRETRKYQVRSGLRLSLNLLVYGVNDIWEQVIPLIPIFRVHVCNISNKNRKLAAKCINKILIYDDYVQKCVEMEVHNKVYEAIQFYEYCGNLLDTALLFVHSGIDNVFISDEFVQKIASILEKTKVNNLTSIFALISELMPKIYHYPYFNDILSTTLVISLNGTYENMIAATYSLLRYLNLETLTREQIIEVGVNGCFEAATNAVSSNCEFLDQALYAIYNFLCIDKLTFSTISSEINLEEILLSCCVDDHNNYNQVQMILNILHDQ